MTRSKVPFAIVAAAAVVVACRGGEKSAAAPSSAGNLIVNGGFEEPQLSAGYQIFPAIPGWKVSSGPGIELQRGVAGSSKDGAQHAELDSTGNTGIEQTLPTRAGLPLSLSFSYSPRPGHPAETNGVEVRVDGKLVATLAEDGTASRDPRWSARQIAFTATGASATLEFRGVGASDGFGGYIDDVKVAQQDHPEVP